MRRPDVRTYLFDVARACELLESFTRGSAFDDYAANPMLRAAVERQFEIAGEALRRTLDADPGLVDRITGARRVITFRDRLIHGYATISDEVVWGIVERHLPTLRAEVASLLDEGERPDGSG